MERERTYTAFVGEQRIATGEVRAMLRAVKAQAAESARDRLLIFDDTTARQVDFDLRGTADEVIERLARHPLFAEPAPRSGPGRPKLGVTAREVTLLPRHWEWLEQQPSGASAALRKLVEAAMRQAAPDDAVRAARDAANRFMTTMGGNLPGYEEATRALYAGELARMAELIGEWPQDVRGYALRLATVD
ncbi:MAG: DUF2239 family protein [Armatimonadetes bacterium]|nr:DUF2239 family protein [Armatimonadota bacterium]